MTKLALAPILAAAALTTGCVATNPIRQDSAAAAPQDNSPRPMASAASAPAPQTVEAAKITWNDEKCYNKNSTVGSAATALMGSNNSCVILTVAGEKAPAKAQPSAQTRANRRTQGAQAAPAATEKTTPIIYSAKLELPACGVSTSGVVEGVKDLVGNIGSRLGNLLPGAASNAAGQAARNAAGGGIAGNIANRAARDATTGAASSATTQGRNAAATAAAPVSEAQKACEKQVSDLATNQFKDGLKILVDDFKKTNPGFTPVVTFRSELPAAQEKTFLQVVSTTVAPK